MRTTVNLDEDIVQSAKALAERHNKTLGEILSELARKGLQKRKSKAAIRNGIPVFKTSSTTANPLSIDEINELRDSE